MIVFPVRIIMSPTSSSRPLAGRKARSAKLRTKVSPQNPGARPVGPTLRLTGSRREGYATAPRRPKREPSPSLAQTREHHHVDAAAALVVAGAHHPLLGEAEAPGERAGG